VAPWTQRLQDFDDLIDEFDNLPATATTQARLALLARAEALVSTTLTDPPPADPAVYRSNLVTVSRPAFAARMAQFDALKDTNETDLPVLMAVITALPVAAFDSTECSLAATEDEIVRFAEDLAAVIKLLVGSVDRKLTASQKGFDDHTASAIAVDKVKALEGRGSRPAGR
jgi:hypothetical protein